MRGDAGKASWRGRDAANESSKIGAMESVSARTFCISARRTARASSLCTTPPLSILSSSSSVRMSGAAPPARTSPCAASCQEVCRVAAAAAACAALAALCAEPPTRDDTPMGSLALPARSGERCPTALPGRLPLSVGIAKLARRARHCRASLGVGSLAGAGSGSNEMLWASPEIDVAESGGAPVALRALAAEPIGRASERPLGQPPRLGGRRTRAASAPPASLTRRVRGGVDDPPQKGCTGRRRPTCVWCVHCNDSFRDNFFRPHERTLRYPHRPHCGVGRCGWARGSNAGKGPDVERLSTLAVAVARAEAPRTRPPGPRSKARLVMELLIRAAPFP